MRIQAAVVESPSGPFTIHHLNLDEPRPDEILVRTTAVGICHTDLSTRRIWPKERLPMVFGHEGAGVVEAVGDAVTTVVPGDAVCLSIRSCNACQPCVTGAPAYCESAGILNFSGSRPDGSTPLSRLDGTPVYGNFFGQSAFATHCLTYESNTIKIPADLPPGCGRTLGMQRPDRRRYGPQRPASVTGRDPRGLRRRRRRTERRHGSRRRRLHRHRHRPRYRSTRHGSGARRRSSHRPHRGERRGSGHPRPHARGPHHAIDTTGRPAAVSQAISALRKRGTLALVGLGTAEFDTMPAITKGLTIRGVTEGDVVPTEAIPQLITLHRQGKLPLDKLITEFPFNDIEAAAKAASAGHVIKPVLTFPEGE